MGKAPLEKTKLIKTMAGMLEAKLNRPFRKRDTNRELDKILEKFPYEYKTSIPPPHKAIEATSHFLLWLHMNRFNFPPRQKRQISNLMRALQKELIPVGYTYPGFKFKTEETERIRKIVGDDHQKVYDCMRRLLTPVQTSEISYGETGKFGMWESKKKREPKDPLEKYHLLKHGNLRLRDDLQNVILVLKVYKSQTQK